MKISKVVQFFCILALMGCAPKSVEQSAATPTSKVIPLSASPSSIQPSPLAPTPVETAMPASSIKIIDKQTLNQLALLHSWDVDGAYSYRSSNFWFSDSNQFIIPVSGKYPMDGMQSIRVDNLMPLWFLKSLNSDFTINEDNQILINLGGLQVFDRQGIEIQTIHTNHFCDIDEPISSYIVAISGTNLVVTGQQDSYSNFGLNGAAYDKARLLIWDISKNSCSELIKRFDGFLSSLSVSDDGRYISYIVVIKTTDALKSIVHIYDLNLRKEKCELADGYNYTARFTRQNQLAVYDSREGTISIVTVADCAIKMKFSIGTEIVKAFAISPSGEMFAGITDDVLRFWDVQTGEKLREISSKGNLSLVGFSPDGHFLVTAKGAALLTEKDEVILWGIPEN